MVNTFDSLLRISFLFISYRFCRSRFFPNVYYLRGNNNNNNNNRMIGAGDLALGVEEKGAIAAAGENGKREECEDGEERIIIIAEGEKIVGETSIRYEGWRIVVASFILHFASLGVVYSFGLYVLPLSQSFGVGRGSAAWAGSIMVGLMLGLCPFSGRALDLLHPTVIFLGGSALVAAGLLGLSYAESLGVAYACAVVAGIGLSFCGPHSATIVQPFFHKKRGMATGISMAGSGLGNVVFAQVLQSLFVTYRDDQRYAEALAFGMSEEDADAISAGWRTSLRIEAGCFFAFAAFASFLLKRPPRKKQAAVVIDDVEKEKHGVKSISKEGDTSIYKLATSRIMLAIIAFQFIGSFGYGNPFLHIDASARDKGLGTAAAAWTLSLMGIGSMIGRVIVGLIADWAKSRVAVLEASIYIMGFATIGWPYATSKASFYVYSFVYGFNAGAFVSLPPSIIADYMAKDHGDRLGTLTGFNFMAASIGTLLGPPIVGWMYDGSGSYLSGGYFTSGCLIVGTTFLFTIPKRRKE